MSDFVDRRAVLRSGAVATALGVAGCLSRLSGDDATPDGNQSDDDPEPDDGEEQRSAVESWPSFQYDAGNSGHAEGRGPRGALTEVWTFEREGKMRGGPVISEDGVVYIGSDEGTMYALDLEDGSLLWSTQTSLAVRQVPHLYEDLLIYSNGNGVYALDRQSGDQVWEFDTEKGRGGATTPVVKNGILVVGGGAMNVFGIDVADGHQLWEADLGNDPGGPPAIVNNNAYIFDWTNEVYIFDSTAGRQKYSLEIDEGQFTGATVVDNVIYAGGQQGWIYALDGERYGEELWRFNVGPYIDQSPAVSPDYLFVRGGGGTISAVDRESGTEHWSNEVGYWAVSAPVVVGNTVYTGGGSGVLYGFDTETGEIIIEEHISQSGVHHPAIAGDTLVVGTSDGSICALQE